MSHEIFVQFNEEGEPERFLTHDQIAGLPRVVLCNVYTHEEDCDMQRVCHNNFAISKFAGQLIRQLGFRIPHPEFYPDEYAKFEKDWAEFTKHAKDHLRIIELLKRGFGCIYDILAPDKTGSIELLDGVADDLRDLGVLKR